MSDIETIAHRRRELQETMGFLAALASGMEQQLGRGASGMSFAAGRTLGRQFAAQAEKTADPLVAIAEVRRVLQANHFMWGFEPYQPEGQGSPVTVGADGATEVQLIFRDCMIRQSLFCFGHPQRGSLCTTMYGFFSGALETVMGCKVELEIIHAGENACLKRLRIRPGSAA
jgi:predicted hydrocarbon binding protein